MKHIHWKVWAQGIVLLVCVMLSVPAIAAQDQVDHPSCAYCGMDRTKFAHSRVYVQYDDGTSVGTCSLHCAAMDLALQIDKTPTSIQVADFETKQLIDAETAVWVIGGSKMGVMTKRAKWAFGNRAEAEAFVKQFGGEITDFDTAIKNAFEDMYEDVKMIREKRRMMKMKHAS